MQMHLHLTPSLAGQTRGVITIGSNLIISFFVAGNNITTLNTTLTQYINLLNGENQTTNIGMNRKDDGGSFKMIDATTEFWE